MKTLLTFAFLFIAFSLGAQNLSDYKYVYVPVKFNDYKTNNAYNLNKILVSKLSDKNFIASQQLPTEWAASLGENSCQILSAELVDISNAFRNRVRLEFKDCNGRVVGKYEATSRIKEFHKGYQDALLQAVAQVPASSGKGVEISGQPVISSTKSNTNLQENGLNQNDNSATKVNTEVLAAAPSTASTLPVKAQDVESSGFQLFTWNGVTYTKVNLGKGHFIFTQPKNTEPFAEFKESARKGVFHVTMMDQASTIGYSEGSNYVVEMRDADGNFTKAVFVGN